ncbi:MAG: hypothetical protein NTV79_01300 [Candidatus Aureabacteria bacterium]|nr:hypothetical protein [Candidatus Auribacterota bacterium]
MNKTPWKPWHQVVKLRDDLKTGQLAMHMFAADLYEVAMQNGKRPEAAILNEASVMGAACPLQLEHCFDGGKINKKATQLMLLKE